jgi:3-methyladenine DNA glycosylase AlkD
MPVLRQLAKTLIDTPLDDVIELLQSPFHEARILALLIWVYQAKRGDDSLPLYRAYLANTQRINNWDLVDVTAEHIVGAHLFEKDRKPLYKLAKSNSLWERRIAIISTFHFIRLNDFDDTLSIADILLTDKEDLIQKAVGWMLREVGKREVVTQEAFLLPRYQQMPRTMLRYAIERFPDPLRLAYLKGRR